ncbi:ATP-binding protein [Hydrogenophaga sp.]|uniref:sensor histidine kinase n=1 Tax=Hydrogenophaga sp. TaxID=1904254 RepID=UPI002614BB37|nr:ATP-binding protein [Hydrogenophaga sp.]MCW5654179.1 two-component sensor histidine kinase [Hydrogenophaga sp.]
MRQRSWQSSWWWVPAGLAVALAGAAWLAQRWLDEQRALFETDARIVHRLLSQRVVQHDAILSTLALLQPARDGMQAAPPEQRLPALYPQILAVQRRDADQHWDDEALAQAEARSRQSRRAALASPDLPGGRYRLVLAATPTSYALTIDLRAMVPWEEWPMPREGSPVRVALVLDGQVHVIQPGRVAPGEGPGGGWRLGFHKVLAADSQPFDVVAQRNIGWDQLPWGRMLAWVVAVMAVLTALRQLLRQRSEQRRAEELLRLGQVGRLNALGELAAGMAHELNQPLTAVLANTQAAQRLLAEEPPELATARGAMAQAAEQARRAADVLGRLRRAVERPGSEGQAQAVDMAAAVRHALYLLEPESRRREVTPSVQGPASLHVLADPVALEQIVHNLILNALQALEQVPVERRRLVLALTPRQEQAELSVSDSGQGIAPEVLPRLFEPFFSTREGGLGLGLSLCESLAQGMGGALTAANRPEGGAVFRLRLPRAQDAPS